jgi:putative acetyltransferase
MIEIRPETPRDRDAVHQLNLAAFDKGPEAALVDQLREHCAASDYLAFVAVDDGVVVGHILFTPVTLEQPGEATGMGLAPLAVLPSHQSRGIGAQLVRHGLAALRARASCPFVIVLGHANYYPRFGFERASRHGLRCQWPGVPDEAFMVLVFDAHALPAEGAVARYRDEFDAAM